MIEKMLEALAYILPALVVFATVYFMQQNQMRKEERLKLLALKKKHSKDSLPLRLQAFERITLLLHRLAPENLIPRVQTTTMDAKTFSFALQNSIKSEFEHNITQQIYISTPTWNKILVFKNNLIQLVREKSLEVKPDENAIKLSEAILTHLMENPETLAYPELMASVKREVKEMFV